MVHPPVWTKDRPNILSPDNINKIRLACETGIIFGLHSYYYGGSAFSTWAYSRFDDFIEDVSRAKPGDYYEVWSAKELESKDLLFIHKEYTENNPIVFSDTDLEIFQNYLNKKPNEFLCIFVNQNSFVTKFYDSNDTNNDLLEDIEGRCNQVGSEIYIFPFTDIDKPEHILVKAKKPNENGEVPIGSAY
jgi:hypothetical protein